MRFAPPETVLSPKGKVTDLKVLLNTGEDGWSLASLNWDGRGVLGMRWNGSAENPIGNPQSRGIATWFVVPDEIAALLHVKFHPAEELGIENSDVTRVRIRPLPKRIWKGKSQESEDDEWVLSVTDQEIGDFEITRISTGHFARLHRSHVKNLMRDTVRNKPNGPKYGILELTVQIVFEDGELRLEPQQGLAERIDEMFAVLWKEGYQENQQAVRELIAEARDVLARGTGSLGEWEVSELDYAETALRDNFLRLALTCIRKAMAVSKLPKAEYEYGLNYGRRRTSPR